MSLTERIKDLLDRAKVDAQFDQELSTNPAAVLERELHVSFKSELSESELATLSGGSSMRDGQCPFCGKTFSDKLLLLSHILEEHQT